MRPNRLFHTVVAAGLLAASASVPATGQTGPATAPSNLPAEILALACAPAMAFEEPAIAVRVTGGQDSFVRRIFQPGDLVSINAGTANGIAVGQEYYVRRVQPQYGGSVTREVPGVIRTTGWIRIYAVEDRMAMATITHACDTIETGDFLETFALPEAPVVSAEKLPAQRSNYGKILLGADRRSSFGTGDFFIVDRGSDHGVTRGAQFVVYRDKRLPGTFMFEIGEAVAVDVRPETSTLRVTVARDALAAGDFVAIRK
jgi:hypothetical protein